MFCTWHRSAICWSHFRESSSCLFRAKCTKRNNNSFHRLYGRINAAIGDVQIQLALKILLKRPACLLHRGYFIHWIAAYFPSSVAWETMAIDLVLSNSQKSLLKFRNHSYPEHEHEHEHETTVYKFVRLPDTIVSYNPIVLLLVSWTTAIPIVRVRIGPGIRPLRRLEIFWSLQ
jgi:hypothetical protein